LQDVFYEFVKAYRMMKPVEQITTWLFRVARNRITDLFRRRKREARSDSDSIRPRPICFLPALQKKI
jgi:DNA-directed RNA polymerase specialized sigma24 family protein